MAGSAAEKWFESFKKNIEGKGFDLSNPAGSLYLNDMNFNPVPAVQDNGMKLGSGSKAANFIAGSKAINDFSKEDIEKVYQLAKTGKLTMTPRSGDFEEIRNVTVAEDGSCKMSAPVNRLEDYNNTFFKEGEDAAFRAERTWKQTLVVECYNHPEYFDKPDLAAERAEMHVAEADAGEGLGDPKNPLLAKHPIAKSLNVEKRLCDFYKESKLGEASLEDLLSARLIRDEKGLPYTIGSKPWDRIDYVTSEIMSDKPVFILSPDKDKVYKPDFKTEYRPEFKEENAKTRLVDPGVKEDAIIALKEVQKKLNQIKPGKTDEIDLTAFKALCNDTINDMERIPYKRQFEEKIRDFAFTADQFYKMNITQKPGKKRLSMLDIYKDIKNIDKCVQKQKLCTENRLSSQDKQRYDIATKSVITLAMINRQSKDPEVKKVADRVLNSPIDREKQIEAHMKSAAFKALYGDKKNPGDDKMLTAASLSKGKDLVKIYNDKVEDLKKESARYEEQKDRVAQSRKNTMGKGPVRPDVKEDLKNMIADMKKGLDALGYEHRTSKEYQAFKQELDITHIRLQRNNPTMNVRKQMADLAKVADKFYLKKTGESETTRGAARFKAASQIRHMADAIAQDKKPSEGVLSEEDMMKEDIAAKMVQYASKQLKKSGAEKDLLMADRMMNNPKVFRDNVKKVLDSPEFKKLYGDKTVKELKDDYEKHPADINKKLAEQRRKIAKDPSIMPVDKQKKVEEVQKETQALAK